MGLKFNLSILKEFIMSQSTTTASYEAVYNTLKKRILDLELVPGTMVSEIETAKEFSVSRTPVRDAFKALVNEGLLEVRPHIGTFVTLIDLNKISTILYIREVIEKAIVKELALSFNPSQEFKLRHILHTQQSLIEDSSLSSHEFAKAFSKSDYDFHQTLCILTGKVNLISYFQTINAQYERFCAFLNFEDKETARTLYLQHVKLLDCIKNNDISELESILTHHIYDHFNNKTNLIYEYPNYFTPLE